MNHSVKCASLSINPILFFLQQIFHSIMCIETRKARNGVEVLSFSIAKQSFTQKCLCLSYWLLGASIHSQSGAIVAQINLMRHLIDWFSRVYRWVSIAGLCYSR